MDSKRYVKLTMAAGLVAILAAPALAKVKPTSTWVAPEVRPATGLKVLVLARFSEETARRTTEDALVAGLSKLGVEAITSYQHLAPADLATSEAIVAKTEELGVSAGIVFSVTGQENKVQSAPTVHASVGVPVRAGPFSLFLGTSVPLGGGTTTTKTVGVKGEFLVESAEDPVWIGNYTTDLKAGAEGEARALADTILKQLKKAGFFPKP